MGLPVLGICYGQMAMAEALGGKIVSCDHQEFGRAFVDVISDCELFHGVWDVGSKEQVWMSHGDRIDSPPPGFRTVATSDGAPFATIADDERHFYGLMYHPEVVHTPKGAKLLENFNHRVCSCVGDWTMASFREQEIDKVRAQVGDSMVICGLSGGVDLSVVAVLLHEAIGDQLQCVFVYTGFMRKVEVDLETKRKLIGATFIDVFEEEANNIGGADFLAQGTLYPDVIESISFTRGHSVTIKSHHNVGGLPERMNMDLVEPLRELFKDEVRELGRELGLPENFVGRHPFPGPGLAIRLPGGVTRKKLEILRNADAVYLDEIRKAGLYDAIWQAFCVLLPVQSVGVMGDARTYDYVCALRAVTSTDGMTADFYHFDMELLAQMSNRIVNEVKGINRVTYDITSKPPGTIEWE
jgi:GMP synthase (glutamine-hydrolysing)